MLFNSLGFIAVFLPITLSGYYLLMRARSWRLAKVWLIVCSLWFYASWSPIYLTLLCGSILANYFMGRRIAATRSKSLTIFGVVLNLAVLAYFKYAEFLLQTGAGLLAIPVPHIEIILPLAISFFTFQQLAYLVDCYLGRCEPAVFIDYSLFVTFFPHLVAGPIVHNNVLLPQFRARRGRSLRLHKVAPALMMFSMGLAKKVLVADSLSEFVTPVFSAAEHAPLLILDAWQGTLAYTFQLYFDFSGYSDMAIGLALLFGIRMPINFNSPYKAVNIADFWRRWHITLSRFLRDYLYIPLGGNRTSNIRRNANLMITMVLGGLWHGASWTFVAWGALHGIYLVVHRAFAYLADRFGFSGRHELRAWRWFARTLTFLAVIVAWVPFRAETFESSMRILSAMVDFSSVRIPAKLVPEQFAPVLQGLGIQVFGFGSVNFIKGWLAIAFGLAVTWFAPNTQELMAGYVQSDLPRRRKSVRWRPTPLGALAAGVLLAFSVLRLTSVTEFMYFRF